MAALQEQQQTGRIPLDLKVHVLSLWKLPALVRHCRRHLPADSPHYFPIWTQQPPPAVIVSRTRRMVVKVSQSNTSTDSEMGNHYPCPNPPTSVEHANLGPTSTYPDNHVTTFHDCITDNLV